MKVILASANPKKIKEIKEILQNKEVLSYLDLIAEQEICENGKTFLQNAQLKAKSIQKALREGGKLQGDYLILADDSGLCVEALKGFPALYSARFANLECSLEDLLRGEFQTNVKSASDESNNLRLLASLKELGVQESEAYFECVIAVCGEIENQEIDKSFEGRLYGKVGNYPLDCQAFGYDPLFVPKGYTQTLNQIEEKNAISHRFIALQKLKDFLEML